MKILHTSDWHVGKVLKGRDRRKEQTDVLKSIYDIATAERPDLIIVAGDLYDTATPSPEATKIRAIVKRSERRARPGVVAVAPR